MADEKTKPDSSARRSLLRRYWPVLLLLPLCVSAAVLFSLADWNHPRIQKPEMADPKDFRPDITDGVRMNKALGSQGELSATHLTVRWSVGCKPELPRYLELKIPREYLMQNPIFVNNGCVESVKLGLVVPGGAPWSENAERERQPVTTGMLEARARGWPRKVHLILKAGSPEFSRRADGMRDHASDPKSYLRTEDYDGLEQRRRFTCFSDADATDYPGTRAYLAAKPPEDKSPANCRLVPSEATLTTLPTVTSNAEVVGMRCYETGCSTYFATGLLSLEVTIWPHQLERWREVLDAARTLARTFVVYESVDAYGVGASKLR